MLITRDQRPWIVATVSATVAGAIGYGYYVSTSPYGPSGGSWTGLFFGILGTLFMVVAGLLAARKKVRTVRIGSAQVWMKMHVWLGLLAVPCIWFHSGFAFGGPLTTVLMVLFYVVIASGIFGLVLQQFVPSMMAARVPRETLHSQIDHVLGGLAADAYELVASIAGEIPEAVEEKQRLEEEEEIVKRQPGYWKEVARQRPAAEAAEDSALLRSFYLSSVRPFLRGDRRTRLSPPEFHAVLVQAHEEWRGRVEKVRDICEEARQLAVQEGLHTWLHGWLFVHAPISFALFVLAAFHIVVALKYL